MQRINFLHKIRESLIYPHYSRGSICQRLGLSSSQLKRRGYGVDDTNPPSKAPVADAGQGFVHVVPTEGPANNAAGTSATNKAMIEVVRLDGTTIRLHHLQHEQLAPLFQQLVGG